MSDAQEVGRDSETLRHVLRDALRTASSYDPPSPREVLEIVVRAMCADMGLPKPEFECEPRDAVVEQVLG